MYQNNSFNHFNPYQNQMYNQPQNQNQYAYVNGIEGAKSYQVQPNQNVLLIDSDNPLAYIKSANQLGQSTIKFFSLKEIDEIEARKTFKGGNDNLINPDEKYALKTDYESLNQKLEDLVKRIDKIGSKKE